MSASTDVGYESVRLLAIIFRARSASPDDGAIRSVSEAWRAWATAVAETRVSLDPISHKIEHLASPTVYGDDESLRLAGLHEDQLSVWDLTDRGVATEVTRYALPDALEPHRDGELTIVKRDDPVAIYTFSPTARSAKTYVWPIGRPNDVVEGEVTVAGEGQALLDLGEATAQLLGAGGSWSVLKKDHPEFGSMSIGAELGFSPRWSYAGLSWTPLGEREGKQRLAACLLPDVEESHSAESTRTAALGEIGSLARKCGLYSSCNAIGGGLDDLGRPVVVFQRGGGDEVTIVWTGHTASPAVKPARES